MLGELNCGSVWVLQYESIPSTQVGSRAVVATTAFPWLTLSCRSDVDLVVTQGSNCNANQVRQNLQVGMIRIFVIVGFIFELEVVS